MPYEGSAMAVKLWHSSVRSIVLFAVGYATYLVQWVRSLPPTFLVHLIWLINVLYNFYTLRMHYYRH